MDDPYAGHTAAVEHVLSLARTQLGMDVAWVSAISAFEQVFLHVDVGSCRNAPRAGEAASLDGSYCARVLDGRMPAVVPDTRSAAETRDLPITEQLGIGSYVGVPIRSSEGVVHAMIGCASAAARPDLGERERGFLEVLASLLGELQTAPVLDLTCVRDRISRAVSGEGRSVVLQPIVEVFTGAGRGCEALSRFDAEPFYPSAFFAEAERVELRVELELAAASDALRLLVDAPGYLSVNLSPDAVLSDGFAPLVAGRDHSRIVLEITEHAAVADYTALRQALAPHREAGMRLAVDDAGAGYASFRHIIELQPDLIKIDISLVRDVDVDAVKQALILSLVHFARAIGADLVAEGVETQAEYDMVARLGVRLVQGHLLARPGERAPDGRYRRPTAEAMLGWPPARESVSALSARLRAGRAAALEQQERTEAVLRSSLGALTGGRRDELP